MERKPTYWVAGSFFKGRVAGGKQKIKAMIQIDLQKGKKTSGVREMRQRQQGRKNSEKSFRCGRSGGGQWGLLWGGFGGVWGWGCVVLVLVGGVLVLVAERENSKT